MKKIIFLLTFLCSCFILNGCGNNSSSFLSNETDLFIGEWGCLSTQTFTKFKIEKKNNEYIYTGTGYTIEMEKESSSPQSPLVIEIKNLDNVFIVKNNFKLKETNDKFKLQILDQKIPQYTILTYDPKTKTISDEQGTTYIPMKNITEQQLQQWAENNKKELLNSYNAKRDGEYGIIDKVDLSKIK